MTEFQPFRLDSENQCLWRDTERITLTPKAFFLLQFLVERAGRRVTHTELLESLWPNTFVYQRARLLAVIALADQCADEVRRPGRDSQLRMMNLL
jgi:DNA-binding winged helix-turn-helix (wHTH) protein